MDALKDVIKGVINGVLPIFPDAPNYWVEADTWMEKMFGNRLLDGIYAGVPYITTMLIMGFAFMLMITGDMHKYAGRMMMTFWIGAAARMVLF